MNNASIPPNSLALEAAMALDKDAPEIERMLAVLNNAILEIIDILWVP
ncbi:MAG: hypothetical protein DHS20C05_09550 [Hyphococcus sp.]|nr:MAG: hypothetical protein DHS20C05_09550 [Marinicaulis sp.]